MSKPKPKVDFGEPADQVKKNAESVKKDFSDIGPKQSAQGRAFPDYTTPGRSSKYSTKKVTATMPEELVFAANRVALERRQAKQELDSLTALLTHGLKLALDDLQDAKP